MSESMARELVFDGFGVAPGIAIGTAHVRESGAPDVPEYRVASSEVENEQKRLRGAAARARQQLSRLRQRVRSRADTSGDMAADEIGYLLDAYYHMLKDSRLLRGAAARIAQDHLNAEAAVQAEISAISESFEAMQDSYLAARVEDIRDVGRRLIRHLARKTRKPLLTLPRGTVIVADELTPADAAQLDPERVIGIAISSGGRQSHTAIMARALRVPAVLGIPNIVGAVKSGEQILVDGERGRVIVNPTTESTTIFRHRRSERQRERKRLVRLAKRRAVTRDGVEIALQANVELPIEMEAVSEAGAAGIGLLRSEFLFINRGGPPSEDEQFEVLRDIVQRAEGHPVTVRTPDFGGEVSLDVFTGEFGHSTSSPLGMRGIRLSLARPEILETQFRAILRAGAVGPVRIMLPLVTSVAEVRAAREILARAARRLHRRGADIPMALPPLGVMVEVPGAALAADSLSQVSNFFAVGSNDLTMYTLAIDRGDQWVAHLYDPLHPSVLRLIQLTAAAALRSRIPVSICGEIAGDPRLTGLLIGLGFRELSMSAASIPLVKRRILELDVGEATQRAQLIMTQSDSARIQALLEESEALPLTLGT